MTRPTSSSTPWMGVVITNGSAEMPTGNSPSFAAALSSMVRLVNVSMLQKILVDTPIGELRTIINHPTSWTPLFFARHTFQQSPGTRKGIGQCPKTAAGGEAESCGLLILPPISSVDDQSPAQWAAIEVAVFALPRNREGS